MIQFVCDSCAAIKELKSHPKFGFWVSQPSRLESLVLDCFASVGRSGKP